MHDIYDDILINVDKQNVTVTIPTILLKKLDDVIAVNKAIKRKKYLETLIIKHITELKGV